MTIIVFLVDTSASMQQRAFVSGRSTLLDVAKELERTALEDPYFAERKLYPNVDFYRKIRGPSKKWNLNCSRCCYLGGNEKSEFFVR